MQTITTEIFFLHLNIQVSDGKDVTEPHLLHIHAVPLRLNLISNTGLDLTSGSTTLITHDNLTYSSNAPNQHIDIRYEVTDPSYDGEIQRQQYDNNKWLVSKQFTQEDIDQFRVRYVHYPNQDYAEDDYFRYRVKAMSISSEEYEFMIRVQSVEVDLLANSDLVLDGVKEMHITSRHLRAQSSIEEHTNTDIVYNIIAAPREGDVMVEMDNGDTERLHEGGNFTQDDINNNKVAYRLHRALFEPIHDHFQFQLIIPGDTSNVHMYDIRYEPIDSDTMFVNNMLMDVIEGEEKVITKEDLYMETAKYKEFSFSIIDGPRYGVIQLIDPSLKRILSKNITTFTNEDIRNQQLVYKHDDSESMHDHFDFTAIPIIKQSDLIVQEISEFTGTFDVQITLKNDNPPRRIVEKTFNVVANRGRMITLDDIKYMDPDVDFDSDMLQYTRRRIPNGEMVQTDNHTIPIFQFTQKELANGKVYFQHSGSNYGRAAIWVTDGQFYSTGLFEVHASDPYVRVANNTGLAVQKGGTVTILISNISIESNLDAEDKNVKFTLTDLPAHGVIKKNGQEKSKFNLADIKSAVLIYLHDGGTDLKDSFKFMVKIDEIQVEGTIKIKVLLESHQKPPQMTKNEVMTLNEGDKVTIRNSHLLFEHEETPPREIKYMIKKHPQYGILSVRGIGEADSVLYFTQEDINRRKVHYTHKIMDSEADTFTFDVTNGISSLQDLEFVFEIIPNVIPMEVMGFDVSEGESKRITKDIIHIHSKYFMRNRLDYVVVKEPTNGWIEDTENTGQHYSSAKSYKNISCVSSIHAISK